MKKILSLMITMVMVVSLFVGCGTKAQETASPEPETTKELANKELILSTTTSTRDSGLLDYILPELEKDTGLTVKVIAVGTGKALQMGQDGEADLLMVHAKSSEEKFVEDGFGVERFDLMYNDFILVGPSEDKDMLKEKSPNNIVDAFKLISEGQELFISRGDDSGTDKKEKSLWVEAAIEPQEQAYYVSAGSSMADVLKIASEKKAYTLTDRATYLNLKDTLELDIIVEKDERLFNQYGLIAVNPSINEKINNEGANAFIDWMLSEKGQKMIGEYGVDKFGMPLFVPNAQK